MDEDEEDEEEGHAGTQSQNGSEEDLMRKAYDLVRLALFMEGKRAVLRRDDINKKVLDGQTRQFSRVFETAQKILKKIFGMQLVELMSRAERERGDAGGGDENAVTGMRKKTTNTSKTYVLHSILDQELLAASIAIDADILEVASKDVNELVDEEDAEDQPDSTLLAWNVNDSLVISGITHVILALILVNSKILPDPQLRAQLKGLKLQANTEIPLPPHFTQKHITLDALLSLLIKQGYLDRQRTASSGAPSHSQAPGTQRGRGRQSRVTGDEDSETVYEWRWGSRAQAEMGEMGTAEFIKEFMGETWRDLEGGAAEVEEDQDADEEQGRGSTRRKGKGRSNAAAGAGREGAEARRNKYMDRMMKDITRAAAGSLTEVQV